MSQEIKRVQAKKAQATLPTQRQHTQPMCVRVCAVWLWPARVLPLCGCVGVCCVWLVACGSLRGVSSSGCCSRCYLPCLLCPCNTQPMCTVHTYICCTSLTRRADAAHAEGLAHTNVWQSNCMHPQRSNSCREGPCTSRGAPQRSDYLALPHQMHPPCRAGGHGAGGCPPQRICAFTYYMWCLLCYADVHQR